MNEEIASRELRNDTAGVLRRVQAGERLAVTVNGRKLSADETHVARGDALHGTFFLLRKGGREVALVEVA